MYFWEDHYQEYIMYYDFTSTTEYQIKYYDWIQDIEDVAIVTIDSITYNHFDSDSLRVQHVSVVELIEGDIHSSFNTKLYEGIGPSDYGLKFKLGCGLCDNFNPFISDIRCFSTEESTYNFVDVACDSTWLVTDVDDVTYEEISVYPNPTTGQILMDDLVSDIDYRLFDLQGRLIQQGVVTNSSLFIDHKGISILKLRIDDQWLTKKVVVLR